MKKIFFSIVTLLIVLVSCSDNFEGYILKGTLNGVANQMVELEFLTFGGTEKIDTATTNADGKFTMKGIAKEPGFYRLKAGEKSWIIFLEDTKINLEAFADEDKVRDVVVKGYPRGEAFQDALNFIYAQQDRIAQLSMEYQTLQFSGAGQDELMQVQLKFEELDKEIKQELKKYASTVTDPLISIYLLSSLDLTAELEFVKEKMVSVTAEAPNSSYTKEFNERIAQAEQSLVQQKMMEEMSKKTAVGSAAPDIVMKNPQGQDMKLSDLKGKVVLLDFWAAWCKPCRMENPNVVAAYNKYKSKGFTVFSVSLDKDREAWLQAIKDDGLVWNTHVSDLQFWQNAAAQLYGINSIPAAFLIDREGNIVGRDLRGTALEEKIKEVI
jgi:peroxiredoxin